MLFTPIPPGYLVVTHEHHARTPRVPSGDYSPLYLIHSHPESPSEEDYDLDHCAEYDQIYEQSPGGLDGDDFSLPARSLGDHYTY